MSKIKVTQIKSVIDRPERQKRTMVALGLRKLNASVEVEATPQILGMVTKVNHLIAGHCIAKNNKFRHLKNSTVGIVGQ